MLTVVVAMAIGLAVMTAWLVATRRRLAAVDVGEQEQARIAQARLTAVENDRAALRAILDGLGEGLLALDRDRHVVLANRRFGDMFGMTGDVAGKPLGEVLRIATVFNAFDAALDGRESTERFPAPAGVAQRRIEVRAIPLASAEIAAVALFIDVTQLERLEQIRRNFISDFTHEVRTPLAGLATAVESYDMTHPMPPEEDRHLRRIMMRQLQRLQRLVDDLSELSGIESGDLTLELREVDLRRLIDDVCEDLGDRAAQKGLRFTVEGEGVHVSCDALRMQQAFSNLLDNAIKYGGSESTIEVSIARTDHLAVVRVTDHGEGIPDEEKERIFRRFYRVDKSRSQDVAGTGLGLAITKHLILLHRGSIDVESEPGKGASFVVRLPIKAAA